jgi:hypothetical protein
MLCASTPVKRGLRDSRPTIAGPAPACAERRVANSNRFSLSSGPFQFKRPSDTLAASSAFEPAVNDPIGIEPEGRVVAPRASGRQSIHLKIRKAAEFSAAEAVSDYQRQSTGVNTVQRIGWLVMITLRRKPD